MNQRQIEANIIRGLRIRMDRHPKTQLELISNARLYLMGAVAFALAVFLIVGCEQGYAEESIEGYTISQYVEAIYLAEGGKNAQYPYGIRSVKCSTKQECERIARNTVKNNIRRYDDYGKYKFTSYLEFLQSRYCPTKGVLTAREKEVNQYWLKNVRYFLARSK